MANIFLLVACKENNDPKIEFIGYTLEEAKRKFQGYAEEQKRYWRGEIEEDDFDSGLENGDLIFNNDQVFVDYELTGGSTYEAWIHELELGTITPDNEGNYW